MLPFSLVAASVMAGQGPVPTPPPTRKGDVVEEKFGVKIADPYRWLEDADADETKAWVKAQNAVTFDYLRAIPGWQKIRTRLEELVTYERFGIPEVVGKRLVYARNSGTQNQSVYYVSDLDGKNPRELLDPNTLSKDGTVAVGSMSFSPDGKYLAYALSVGGSDWQEWHVRDVATGKDLADVVPWSKFSGASWSADGHGFYYGAFDPPKDGNVLQAANYYAKVYFHRLGEDPRKDKLVYQDPEHKEWGFGAAASEDGRYLIIQQSEGTRPENRVYIQDLKHPEKGTLKLLNGFDAQYDYLGNDGTLFYFLTDKDAPNRRVIAIDLAKSAPAQWKTLVPESKEALQSVSLIGDRFFASYLQDAHSVVRQFDLKGKDLGPVSLPGLGTSGGFGGRRKDKETFFSFVGFTSPSVIYRLNVGSGGVSVFKQPSVKFDPSQYVTTQVFYPSKDGTKVPMFLTYKKGLRRDGTNPTLLYGYGGFNIASTPGFSVRTLTWLEMGGVYAVANIRGGSEYGRAWYDAGRLKNKQNVFDDFIAAAEFLIRDRYTSPAKLAINGGSNGGLLVGACMTQRPELFGAALPAVGVLDMLRFDQFTIGYAWKSDYGDPAVEADFRTLLAYSPLHNVHAGTAYPATMVMTGDHDDRVVPAHSFKFAATLQAAQAGPAPILIRIETSGGHGAGKPLSKTLDESADMLAFLVKSLNITMP